MTEHRIAHIWVAYDPAGPDNLYSAGVWDGSPGWGKAVERYLESGRAVKRVTPDDAIRGMGRYAMATSSDDRKPCPNAQPLEGSWADIDVHEVAFHAPHKGWKCRKDCPLCGPRGSRLPYNDPVHPPGLPSGG